MRRYAPICTVLGLSLLLAQPVLAQLERTAVGAVGGTIDGTPYSGETLHLPSEGTATAEFRRVGPITMLTVQAHDPEVERTLNNVLTIEVSLLGTDASSAMMDPSISWWPGGMGEAFYHSAEGAPEIVIDSLSLDDGDASVSGRFAAQLCRMDSFFSEADLTDCRVVEGSFETVLHRAD